MPLPLGLFPCERVCPKRHQPSVYRSRKSRDLANNFTWLRVSVERVVGNTAVCAGVIQIQNDSLLIHPLAILNEAETMDAREPIGTRRDHRDQRNQWEISMRRKVDAGGSVRWNRTRTRQNASGAAGGDCRVRFIAQRNDIAQFGNIFNSLCCQ